MSRKKDIEIEVTDSENETAGGDSPEQEESPETNGTASETESAEQAPEQTEEEKLRARVAELEDKHLRTIAEFENYRKRQARQYDELVRTANDRVLTDLLEIVDNLERALDHAGKSEGNDGIRSGTEMILNQMKALLGRYDVTPIESLGRSFDPNLHEALMQVDSDEYDEGTVAVEITRGYKRGDRVLRHARVGVSTGKAPSEPE